MSEKMTYKTLSWQPDVAAGILRAFVLGKKESGIDTLEPWVRFRIEEAAEALEEAAKRLEALEKYVTLIQEADSKAFADLCTSTATTDEQTEGA
jgi:hypothetical protein